MTSDSAFHIQHMNLYYDTTHALKDISLDIKRHATLALIGPSGCGKSSFLRCLNRMNDLVPRTKVSGKVLLDGQDIYAPQVNTTLLRKRVGMVFQQANPFPLSCLLYTSPSPRD